MKKRWTPEEDKLLVEGALELPNRTSKAVMDRRSKLGLTKSVKRWTPEEDTLLTNQVLQGIPLREIIIPNRNYSGIDKRIRVLNIGRKITPREDCWTEYEDNLLKGGQISKLDRTASAIVSRKHTLQLYAPVEYSEEYLLDIVRKYVTLGNLDYLRKPHEPSSMIIKKYFGTWNKAVEAAGLDINRGGLKDHKDTILYLVDFGEFKKFGVTQRSIKERLALFPKYHILDQVVLSLVDAISAENEIKENVRPFRKLDAPVPNGYTECFVASGTVLEDFL